jgi:inorganic pyrophosphatase
VNGKKLPKAIVFKQIRIRRGNEMDIINNEFWKALDELVSNSEIVIDRAKGTAHPNYPDFIYRVDYGYLKNTTSMDGGGIDVWVGTEYTKQIDAIMCIVDLKKRDSEIKILIGCTEDEKKIVYQTHNETQFMKGIMIQR